MPNVPTLPDAEPLQSIDRARALSLDPVLIAAARDSLALAKRIAVDTRELYQMARFLSPAAHAASVLNSQGLTDPDEADEAEVDVLWYSGQSTIQSLAIDARRLLKACTGTPLGQTEIESGPTAREFEEQADELHAILTTLLVPEAAGGDMTTMPVPAPQRVAAALSDALEVYATGQRLAAEYEAMQSAYIAPVWDSVGDDATPDHPAVKLDESTGVHLLYRILRDAADAIAAGLDGATYEKPTGHLTLDAATGAVATFLSGE